MIFTGFKRKTNQIFFNKKLTEFVNETKEESSKKINNIIVIIDAINDEESIVKELSSLLKVDKSNITTVIAVNKKNKKAPIENSFSGADFGWRGKVKSDYLKNILTKKYDLLINYSKVDNLYVNLLILQCKSVFNAGFTHLNNELYQLLVDCEPDDYTVFNSELKKYLTILKKL
ncbi:hypothetical protein SAMN05444411_106163 [Lutibacter oricola]|uniref:Uncharacterized protein n=1 Tax=Lutibacter oricola TaxID=762486 RepID=A0A1H3CHU5_9FLAO|nr:hypothetical protein [Lutibacter oricola]SDX53478.1 hypothetical protein SAMN05444411_106163 [Lutibacter oricola]